jgi:hypothetical protein
MPMRNSPSIAVLDAARGEAAKRSKYRRGEKPPKGEGAAHMGKPSKMPFPPRALMPTALRREWREHFLKQYPRGFYDSRHIERTARWNAHEQWEQGLNKREFYRQIRREDWAEIAHRAIEAEAVSKLLSSSERQSLREMLKPAANAKLFGRALFDLLHGPARLPVKFALYTQTIAPMLAKAPRGHQWPLATVFLFLSNPDEHLVVRPSLMQAAAASYSFSLSFEAAPNWQTYARLLAFADVLKSDLGDLHPRDLIDVYCFISLLADGDER